MLASLEKAEEALGCLGGGGAAVLDWAVKLAAEWGAHARGAAGGGEGGGIVLPGFGELYSLPLPARQTLFTGLVEILGTIKSIHPTTEFEGYSFIITDAHDILGDCKLGDSIAVNGCCLTVTRFDANKGWFEVGLANETLSRTNLGKLGVGSKVNLERAMAGHGRFGGHFVQGHVDTTAKIVSKVPDGDSIRMLFSLPLEFFTPMIPKGYVALDGTSLTLTHLSTPRTAADAHFDPSDPHRGVFGVMLIAHTQSRTVVAAKEVGDTVNVECDIVGKGVESVVRNVLEGGGESGGALEQMIERVVGRVLVEKGLVKQ